ncbi:MAG: hypothetical protein R2838_12530 [Caldilineaceae bacterium]
MTSATWPSQAAAPGELGRQPAGDLRRPHHHPAIRDVIVKLGNDGLHFRWGGALGPNSDVQCVAFAPAPFDRTVETTVVVGGIKNILSAQWAVGADRQRGVRGSRSPGRHLDPGSRPHRRRLRHHGHRRRV